MKIPFWKMHGAGNDFILLNRACRNPPAYPSSEEIRAWCRPHTGIGADGLILVEPPDAPEIHFRMVFFNPDGGEAAMCGNGARCVARLAFEQGIAPSNMCFGTGSGHMHATVKETSVTLDMQLPASISLGQQLALGSDDVIQYDFADTGVPHVVVVCPDVASINLPRLGKAIREHANFSPDGTNVDFIQILSDGALRIRTYERGVEAETLACGTGVAAAALTAVLNGRTPSPVHVHTAGGDTLVITVKHDAGHISSLQLTGPAQHVFQGHITDNPLQHERS